MSPDRDETVVGVFASWPEPPGRSAGASGVGPLYRRAVWVKANPRDEHYMRRLFEERYPHGRFLSTDDPSWAARASAAATVVLLYPDATGVRFGPVERAVRRHRDVRVLNGRRREFALTPAVHRQLRRRRLLERTMVPEMLGAPVIVIGGAVLAAVDGVRGRS